MSGTRPRSASRSPRPAPFASQAVAEAFTAFDPSTRPRLLEIRDLVFTTALRTRGVGPIREELKWGQPSYVPEAPRTGSPLRLGAVEGCPAIFFHCQTSLVASFRERYEGRLQFIGNRAVVVDSGRRVPRKVVAACIADALTYHLHRRSPRGA